MDNERQSSLPSSLLPHLYTAPNQPRDSGTRTTIDSDDDHADTHQISPVQFPLAPPRRIYTQAVQSHPHPQQQQLQRPFLPYDLDQQPAAGATHNVAHHQQYMYADSLLPSSTRTIMPVGRATTAYTYPPLQPPASRQQLASGTSTATRTSWNEGEPGPSSLLHHPHHPPSRAARHRRGESLSPRVLPHVDPFGRRTATYEQDPSSFGHVVRRDAERDTYFSSLPGPPTIPHHHQHLPHSQSQQHPQHQSVSSYFAQQPQPPSSQNYPDQQHSQRQQYQHQHQQQQQTISASQSLSLSGSRSQQHLLLPDNDNDTAGFTFHTEPQSYGGSYASVNSFSINTPSPNFPSSSSSGGEGSSTSYTLYRRSTLPNEPTHPEHRLDDLPRHTTHHTHANLPVRPTEPSHDRPGRLEQIIYGSERTDRAALPNTWYASTGRSSDLKHGPLFSVVSPRNNARARMEGLSRIIPMDLDERDVDRGSEVDRDRDKDWDKHWSAGASSSTPAAQGASVGVAPGEGQGQAEGSAGGAVSASASTSGGGGGKRSRAKAAADKRRRKDVDELARQSKDTAIQKGYRHDQKVWQREEAKAKRPKKTPVACDFCRGRKLRCNGDRPNCSHCVARGLVCFYVKEAKRRGPGKAPRGSRAKKNAEARAIAESSVVFKNGVDPAAFKAKPPEKAEGGGARGGRRKGGAAAAAASASTGAPAEWPVSLVGMRGEGGMVQEGAGLGVGLPGHSGAGAVVDEHEYELEMLAPEVRPYASVLTLDGLGSAPPPHHQRHPPSHRAPAPTLRGYAGAETLYGATETGASGLAPRMGAPGMPGAAGGTAAGDGVRSNMSGRSGGPAGAGMSSSLSISAGGGTGSMSGSGAYGFEPPSPSTAPHYPPGPPPDRRYDTTEQARAFRDAGGGNGDMNMNIMGMDMGGGSGMMGEMGGSDGGGGLPGSASAYNYSRERTVTGQRSMSEAERKE